VRSTSGIASQGAGHAWPGAAEESRRRPVLYDFLAEIGAMRRVYDLPEAIFGLKQIEREPVAKQTVKRNSTRRSDKKNEHMRCREAVWR
jgi:hypothetical protein